MHATRSVDWVSAKALYFSHALETARRARRLRIKSTHTHTHTHDIFLLSASMHRARNLTTFQVKYGRHTRVGMRIFTVHRCEGGKGLARSCMYMARAGILIIFSHQLESYSMYLCHVSSNLVMLHFRACIYKTTACRISQRCQLRVPTSPLRKSKCISVSC